MTHRRWAGVAAAAALVVTGCRSPLDTLGTAGAAGGPGAAVHAATAAPAAEVAGGPVGLIQEPDAGSRPVLAAIDAARVGIDMTMYELADPAAEADLIAAHRRGVAVRIILDRAFHGQQVNQPAYDDLGAAGIAVHGGPDDLLVHQKTITVDGVRSLIGTGNLTARYYPTTRDAWIDDRVPNQVHAIAATFAADWDSSRRFGPQVGAAGLIWSPGAAPQLTAYRGTARRSVEFSSEELSDPRIVAALSAAARRGVSCRIVMTASTDWTAAFTAVTRAGCAVHTYPDTTTALYIHEKLILIDATSMLIGSQNATAAGLNRNRELSIIITAPTLLNVAAATFAADYRTATPWTRTG